MRDRKLFLLFLSVLITGAFLLAVVIPAVASPVSERGQAGSMVSQVAGPESGSVVQEWSDRHVADRASGAGAPWAVSQDSAIRSTPSAAGESTTDYSPGSGFPGDAVQVNLESGSSSWIHDLIERSPRDRDRGNGRSHAIIGEGTIRCITLGGDSFFGIVTKSGDHFIPDSLPDAFEADGIHVTFRGIAHTPEPNVRMWGTPLSLISIEMMDDELSATGTVTFIELEGGFFGIITSAGEKYLPLNLPDAFRTDGMEVTFTAHEERDTATIFMWGIPIHLESIDGSGEASSSLTGSWYLVRYLDGSSLRPIIPGTVITADFSDNGMVTGTAGCNRYFGSCEVTGSTIEVGTIGATKMYCSSPTGSMQQESTYLNLLGKASAFSMKNGNLVLLDEKGNDILIFSKGAPDTPKEPVPLVDYTRTGGFAGFDDHLVLYPDGSASVNRKESARTITVPSGTLRELASLLERADFGSLKGKYPASHKGADYFTYSLTYEGKTVVTEDTAVPAVLMPVIDILNEIIGNSAPDDVIPPLPLPMRERPWSQRIPQFQQYSCQLSIS